AAAFNIAPTQFVPVIRQNPRTASRELSLVRWGLVPAWSKDSSKAAAMINLLPPRQPVASAHVDSMAENDRHGTRVVRTSPNFPEEGLWPAWCIAPSRRLDRTKPSGRRAADAIAYTQTTCSTGAMPTPQSSAANTMDNPCSPTWQAFTPTQLHKPGNKN